MILIGFLKLFHGKLSEWKNSQWFWRYTQKTAPQLWNFTFININACYSFKNNIHVKLSHHSFMRKKQKLKIPSSFKNYLKIHVKWFCCKVAFVLKLSIKFIPKDYTWILGGLSTSCEHFSSLVLFCSEIKTIKERRNIVYKKYLQKHEISLF